MFLHSSKFKASPQIARVINDGSTINDNPRAARGLYKTQTVIINVGAGASVNINANNVRLPVIHLPPPDEKMDPRSPRNSESKIEQPEQVNCCLAWWNRLRK